MAKRVTYPQPRYVKRSKRKVGISFIGTGRIRKKVTTRQDRGAGSLPFVIKGRHSGKKVPVYVPAQFERNKTAQTRKVKAMYFSSLAHLARKDWREKVAIFSMRELKKEYPKQLKKAKY